MKTKYFFVAGLLVACLFGAASSLFPSEPCKNWDARGSWKLTGQLHEIDMHLDQSGTNISGRATSRGDVGDVVGNIRGDALGFQIKWSTGAVATFWGNIEPYNPIKGLFIPAAMTGYKGATYNWSADRAMPCADSASAAVTAPAPTGDSAPQARTPLIKAHPRSDGTSTLIWDAGNDHPAAEVWVEVNGHEKKLFAQANKGRREVTVQPGKNYVYILTDSRQKLATVTVQGGQEESMDRHPNGKKHKQQRDDDSESYRRN